jgi:hypothetical protein
MLFFAVEKTVIHCKEKKMIFSVLPVFFSSQKIVSKFLSFLLASRVSTDVFGIDRIRPPHRQMQQKSLLQLKQEKEKLLLTHSLP